MSRSEFTFEKDGLEIVVGTTSSEVTVTWRGASDSRTPLAFLSPLVDKIIEVSNGRKVTVDFSRLDFMNSSTITSVIGLVKSLNETSPSVVVIFADVDWQRVHMRCMRTITRVLDNVRVEGRPAPLK